MLSESREHVNHQFVRVGIVDSEKIQPRFNQGRYEGDVTSQAVKFGDYERSLLSFAQIYSSEEFSAVISDATLDFHELADELARLASYIVTYSLPLGVKSETAPTLFSCTDSEVTHELLGAHCILRGINMYTNVYVLMPSMSFLKSL
jgi:hypothetical protein